MKRPRIGWTTLLALVVALGSPWRPPSSAFAEVRRPGDVLPDSIVRFKTGSTDLTAVSEVTLDGLAEFLKRRTDLSPVLIVGHADDRGSEALNQRLSLGRAQRVKNALVGRGLEPARLQVEGAGSREPLTEETTEAGRARNRRVEVWVTPRGPVARIGRVQRRVQAREPAAPKWRRAQPKQALRRLSRVRTLSNSSSEIRFPRDDLVTLGPNALAVVFGSPAATRKSRRATADIELEEGSLFAALAKREGRIIDIQARSSRVRVRSLRTRVSAQKQRQRTTVAVYDGESEVESAGERVTVPRGFGTLVKDGQPPEPPRRLPAPPQWKRTEVIFRIEGEPTELTWRAAPSAVATELQLGVGNDVKVLRPVLLTRVQGSTTSADVSPGMYAARLASIDDRDLVGVASAPRPIIVLPRPTLDDGDAPLHRASPTEPLRLPRPGIVRFAAPPKSLLSVGGRSSTVAVALELFASRTVVLGLKATDGGPTRYIPLELVVPTQRVKASIGTPTIEDGRQHIPIELLVVDEMGQGVEGLEFQVGPLAAATDRLSTGTEDGSVLAPCQCRVPPETTPATALGGGRYAWTLTSSVGDPVPSTVRFYTDNGTRAVETPLPTSIVDTLAESAVRRPRVRPGLFATTHAGTWLGTSDDPVFQLSLGFGGQIPVERRLAVDVWALARWFEREDGNDTINVVPLTARVALRYTDLVPQLYIGGGAGVRLGDPSVEPVGEAFGGVLLPLSVIDLDIEASYAAAGSTDNIDELAGWGLRVGLRWPPNR